MNIHDILLQSDAAKLGEFEPFSGTKVPVYFDISAIISNPRYFDIITDMLADKIREINPDKIAGAFTSGIPLATALCLKTNIPMVFVRRESKQYGFKNAIEGRLEPGETVVLVDDMITELKHNESFIDAINSTGAKTINFLVVMDYNMGAKESLNSRNIELESLTTFDDIITTMSKRGILTKIRAKQLITTRN